jgi:uncharacterized Zn finger protein
MIADKCQCSQCGATDFKNEKEFLRCTHCGSLFRMSPQKSAKSKATVTIKKGGKVTFGKNSKITVRGGIFVEEGGDLEILGELEIIEKAPEKDIEKAKSILKLKKDQSNSGTSEID